MKKLLNLLLVFSVVITSAGNCALADEIVSTVAPPLAGYTEMINNGGYETVDEAIKAPTGWDAYNSQNVAEGYEWTENKVTSLNDEYAHSGKYSLRVDQRNSLTDIGYASQKVFGPQVGVTYQTSFWARTDMEGVEVRFYYESYLVDNTSPVGFQYLSGIVLPIVTLKTGEWQQYVCTFTLPEKVDYIRHYVMVRKGMAYLDDLSMYPVSLPSYISIDANERYYYTDLEKGYASVRVADYYKESAGDYTVDVALKDGDEVLSQALHLQFEDGIATWVFDPQLMTDRDKAYKLEGTLRNFDGSILETAEYRVERRYDRPQGMTKNGRLLNDDGLIYMPIDAYEVYDHIEGESIFAEVKRMGVNCLQGIYDYLDAPEEAVKRLDYLYAQGFKVIGCLYLHEENMASTPAIAERVKRLVEMCKNHPAILAWNLCDEPIGKGFKEEDLDKAYRMIRDIDPVHPTYIGDQRMEQVKQFYRYCDIVGADNYLYNPDSSYAKYYLNFWDECGPALKLSGKAIIDDLQTFKRSNEPNLNNVMNYDSIRNVIYQCLFGGVAGFGYYTFNTYALPLDEEGNRFFNAGIGKAIESWLANEQEDAINYFLKEEYPTFADVRTDAYALRAYVKDGDIYYIVINNSGTEPLKADIDVVSKSGKVTVQGFKGEALYGLASKEKDVSSNDGKLHVSMAPYETVVYKLTPASPIDVSLLPVEEQTIEVQNDRQYAVTDIAAYSWAAEAIDALYAKGIVDTKVQNSYEPAREITRGEFTAYLMRTLRLTGTTEEPFADISDEYTYAKEILSAKALGIVNGIDGIHFNPEAPISRQDVMTITAKAMRKASKLLPGVVSALDGFSDKDSIAEYAVQSVADLVQGGIIVGADDGCLHPQDTMTRAEAASMCYKVLFAKQVETVTPDVVEQDEVIAFSTTLDENKLEKAKEAKTLLAGLGVSIQNDFNNSVTNGNFEKMLSALLGYEFDRFEDNRKALRTEDAVDTLIDILGYTPYAAHRGGALTTASQIGLLSGITTEETYAKNGEIAIMLRNMLDIQTYDRDSYGPNETYSESDATFAEEYLELQKITGKVTANRYTNLAGGNTCGNTKVVLKDGVFDVGNTDIGDRLGETVIAYVDKEDVVRTVLSKSTVLSIDGARVLEETVKTSLHYADSDDKTHSYSIAPDATLVRNGTVEATWTKEDLCSKDSEYRYIITNNHAEVILQDALQTKIIKSIDKLNEKIFFNDGTAIDIKGNDTLIFIKGDGTPTDIASCAKWNVLSVATDRLGNIVKLILSADRLTGTVSEISSDSVVVGGKKYKLAASLAADNRPEMGKEAKFALNYKGEIAFIMEDGDEANYAYLMAGEKTKGLRGKVQLKYMSDGGEIATSPLAERVDLNGTVIEGIKVLDADNAICKYGKIEQHLITYTLNTAGEITELSTAVDGTKMSADERVKQFSVNFYIPKEQKGTWGRFNGYDSMSFATKYRVTADTKVFVVPDKANAPDDEYGVEGSGYFAHDGEYGNCYFYNVDRNNDIGAIVIRQSYSSIVSITDTNMAVIDSVKVVLDGEGNSARAIDIVTGQMKKTILLPDDVKIEYNSKSIADATQDKKFKGSFIESSALEQGDVIQYATDAVGKEFTAIAVRFRANYPMIIGKAIHTGNVEVRPSEYYNYYATQYSFSLVKSVVPDGLITEVPSTVGTRGYERLYSKIGNKVVLCDGKTKTVQQMNAENLLEGDKVFVYKNNTEVMLVAVYRNM